MAEKQPKYSFKERLTAGATGVLLALGLVACSSQDRETALGSGTSVEAVVPGDEASVEESNKESEAPAQEFPSPTEPQTSEATADTTKNATPEKYTMPEYAKPAKDMVNNFFANYTVDDISNMRPLGQTIQYTEARLTETAQLLGAIHVNALEAYEQTYIGVGSELYGNNTLFKDPHTMTPGELAQALNTPLYYAMLQTDRDIITASSVHNAGLDKEKAKKLACLHMCSGSSNQWVRFRDFLDGYSPYKNMEQPGATDIYIEMYGDTQATATITKSQMVEVDGLGKAELVTIQRKGDNLQPEHEWEEKWLFVPYSVLPELPGIDGTSAIRDLNTNDPVDFNRPRPDGNGGYVTLDGTPAIVPVLLN